MEKGRGRHRLKSKRFNANSDLLRLFNVLIHYDNVWAEISLLGNQPLLYEWQHIPGHVRGRWNFYYIMDVYVVFSYVYVKTIYFIQ